MTEQVALFESNDVKTLNENINSWIMRIIIQLNWEIVDIKFSCSTWKDYDLYSAMIIYKIK